MAAHLQQVPVPPIERDPRLPAALNDVIMMAIEKDPAKRFQSANAMLGALRAVGRGAAAHAPVSAPPRAPTAVPPPPPAAMPAPLPAVKPAGRRGLYMALGALAAVGVIVIAAIQIPKLMKTQAQNPASIESPAPVQSTPQQAAPVQQPTATEPTPTGQPQTQQAGPPASVPAKTYTGQPAARPPVTAPSQQHQPTMQASQPSGQSAPMQSTQAQSTPQQAAPQSNPADAARQASLNETREHLMLLGTRAVAVKSSINALRAEQSRQGLGLRGDISAGLQRMEYFLDQTEEALKRGDADAAKKNLSNAERETGKLESFLGR
jgi:serine/threonine-protein kinase